MSTDFAPKIAGESTSALARVEPVYDPSEFVELSQALSEQQEAARITLLPFPTRGVVSLYLAMSHDPESWHAV